MANRRTRFWCFTLNNPDGNIDVDLENDPAVRYAVWQLEIGEEGTEHFQGYLEICNPAGLSFVRRILPLAHWEQCRDPAASERYAQKEDTRIDGPWKVGSMGKGQGTRSDVQAFKKAIDEGASDLQLWDDYPMSFLRYGKMIDRVRELKNAGRSWKTEVWYVYGRPGTGKSYWCNEREPGAYWKQPGDGWFDGYHGQETVIFDEYRKSLTWAMFLQVMDRYPLRVPIKGGFVPFVAKRLYITTNAKPKDLYEDQEKYPLAALTRRVEHWVFFEENELFGECASTDRHREVRIREFSNWEDASPYFN